MSIFLDTGVLLAYLDGRDDHHSDAVQIVARCLDGEHGEVLTSSDVLDELLTLLQARASPWEGVLAAAELLGLAGQGPGLATPLEVTAEVRNAGWQRFEQHYDEGLSFTDCTTLAIIEQARVDRLATFDSGFDGLVDVLPDTG